MSIVQNVKLILLVAFVAAILYLPILSADFVYDDILQIKIDPYIHQHEHFVDVLSLKVMAKGALDNNRPVMLLSLMTDSMLWGMMPCGYHLTNLLLHSLCSVMVFVILYAFLKRLYIVKEHAVGPLWAAFIGVILFAIHPINTEAVCVVSFREDLLVTAFALLSLLLAGFFPCERKIFNVFLGISIAVSVFAAAATKENGAAVPFFLLLYWLFIRKASEWRKWVPLIAAGFAATLTFMILRFTIVAPLAYAEIEKASYPGGSFLQMLLVQPRIWTYQLLELFWPNLMCADITAYSLRNISFLTALIFLILIIFMSIIVSRKNSGVGIGLTFFVLAMLPTSNFVPIYRPIADRYFYLAMFGLSLAISAIVCRVAVKKRLYRIFLVTAAFIIGFNLCCFTIERELVWHSSLSLWQDTVNKNPCSFLGNFNLGFALFNKGEYQQALSSFGKASEINPYSPAVQATLAMTCESLGQTDDAEKYFRQAVAFNNPNGDSDSLISSLLWTQSQIQKLQIIADRIAEHKKME